MKELLILLFAILPLAATAQSNTQDEGVVINGVRWATRNVDEPGTFAPTPESDGKFYQYEKKKAWKTTGRVWKWDKYYHSVISCCWKAENDPSPDGWRVPSEEEFKSLLEEDRVSSEWVIQNGVYGAKFSCKITGNSIFLPAVGQRFGGYNKSYRKAGELRKEGTFDKGKFGDYWSNFGQHFSFFEKDFAPELSISGEITCSYISLYGRSVRSVSVLPAKKVYPHIDTSDSTRLKDEGVMINGVCWATRNLDAPGTFTAKPENDGMYYEWKTKKAWTLTTDNPKRNGTLYTSVIFENDKDVFPSGWRLPNEKEIWALRDTAKVMSKWINQNGVNGMQIIDKATGSSIFLPAIGYRQNYNGECGYSHEGIYGTNDKHGHYLGFNSQDVYPYVVFLNYGHREAGVPVRCVAEK